MEAQKLATRIVQRLKIEGYTAYFAGGWVRDYLLKHPSADIDIATDAPLQVILDLFPRTQLVGLAFGVVIVQVDGHAFEVASFRRDISYTNGRKPDEIALATPEEDAQRRDFTINGLFYDPLENKIFDYVDGMKDLERGVIRAIGNPSERFFEDRLRMIRAVRFAARFNFHMDPETEEAIQENADSLFPAVASERVYQELTKMADSPHFDRALIDLHRLKLLEVMFPSLAHLHLHDLQKRVQTLEEMHDLPMIVKLREVFKHLPLDEQLRLCYLLKAPTRDREWIEYLYKAEPQLKEESLTSDYEWAHFYAHPNWKIVREVVKAGLQDKKEWTAKQDARIEKLKSHIERIQTKKPVVSAAHLMTLGIKPSKDMGKILKEAEILSINLDIHDPELILPKLKKYVQNHQQ